MKKLSGIGVALVTPFNKQGAIDFKSIEKIVSFVIKEGVQYLVLLGTTGEASTLHIKEKIDIINCVMNINSKKLPIVVGIGSNNTEEVILNLKKFTLNSVYAILSVCPYYNKPSQKGIFNHFKTISENTDKNIIIYNVPHRTGTNISLETINKLILKYENIIGIKEASGNILQSYNIINNKSKKNFSVFSGDDNLSLPIILGGGEGMISVVGQAFPKELSKMFKLACENKVQEAYKIYFNIIKIYNIIFKEGNPSGIKTLLKLKGLCNNYVRLPLMECSNTLEQQIKLELNYLKF
ncbi:4-hydroxy-tetrahydrodipicolinate synthase [Candidatus Karelsulcia muelleri]|uniref:4-hydroxy-tetrahydrodipicolinate synthase n=1 Tax=Candidatus Karelsulcia muelleri TaxID=336810 RepID=UPI000D7C2CA1|nr:4-hydroxy-tetrahydrodipicolinate synthase [Candidatus Karelsulcia muelleri]